MYLYGDFHIHTNFCPHGTKDTMEDYIHNAICLGVPEISFTEHAPLPKNFKDPAPKKDSAMRWEDIDTYISEGKRLKEKYRNDLIINIGFEVDFIEGYEREITDFLNEYGEVIDDAILSVHMLKAPDHSYVCLDYSAEEFSRIVSLFGGIDHVYQAYYRAVLLAVETPLGSYKPQRIGHLTLIEKFNALFKPHLDFSTKIDLVLQAIKKNKLNLDLNTAGLFKTYCKTLYPNPDVINRALELNIKFVPGSDSHSSDTIARGFNQLSNYLKSVK